MPHLKWMRSISAGLTTGLKALTTDALIRPRLASSRPAPMSGARKEVGPREIARTSSIYASRGEGRLSNEPPIVGDRGRSFRYDPEDPAPTQLDVRKYPIEDVPLDQSAVERRRDVVSYTSPVLTEELVVSGWPHLELFGSSDCDDTEWHVKLTDVQPDGRSLKVSQGCLRASYRDSLQHPTPLIPGAPHRFDVELWPTNHAFLPGHRLRITITSSDFPWFARSLNRFGPIATQAQPRIATNSVHHTPALPSRIILPIVRGELPA